MIFVTLGTQDKSFERLLQAIEREIERGNIKEKVVVQAGYTKYESKNMEIMDLVSQDEFDKLMKECSLLITHGGVGSILTGIKYGKPVIAAARLKKYKEHNNDHQKQIIKEFGDLGYILELRDFNKLGKMIEKSKTFKARKFTSNTKNMINLVSTYIEEDNHTSWYNKYREVLLYLVFGGLTTVVNIVSFFILRQFDIAVYISNAIAWLIAVIFAFITNRKFVFESNGNKVKELISFFAFRILSLGFDMGSMFLLIDILHIGELISKVLANILVIILNYIFSKLFIFKK